MINPNISVDCGGFGLGGQNLNALLIEQKDFGQSRKLALPGDHLEEDENVDTAAQRVLREITSLSGLYLRQSGAFGDPNRVKNIKDLPWLQSNRSNPEARVITIAYYALVKMSDFNPSASSFAERVLWQEVQDIPELAFDHSEIVTTALNKLRNDVRELRVGHELLPEKFTLTQVQSLHESILNSSFDKRNFRKKALNDSWVIPLDEKQTGVFHKPARLYSWNKDRLSL